MLRVEVAGVTPLSFGVNDPVRAASAVAPLGDGWLVGQDDANHAAWWRPDGVSRVRLFPTNAGLDVFGPQEATKRLKPDVEAACPVEVAGRAGVLLLGSGSTSARTRIALVVDHEDRLEVTSADPVALYRAVAAALELDDGQLNLEGGCIVGDRLRWFQRGQGRTNLRSGSVDLDLAEVLEVVRGRRDPATIRPRETRRYDLGRLGGFALTITDAVTLPDGRILVSAAAEDTPDAVADGPIAGSALAILDPDPVAVTPIVRALSAEVSGSEGGAVPWKLEGLAFVTSDQDGVTLVGVVDQDDPTVPSLALELRVQG